MGLLESIGNAIGGPEEEKFYAYSMPGLARDRVAAQEAERVKGFDEIAGLDPLLRQRLYSWKFELRNSDPEEITPAFRGILFIGPPGVGKTMLADALIKEAGEFAEKFNPDKVASEKGWNIQESPDALYKAILKRSTELAYEDSARNQMSFRNKTRKLIVFMDEVERFFPKRTGKDAYTSTAIAWFNELQKRDNIWVIGMTNHPEFMSKAARDRFTEKVDVRIPDHSQLIDLFAYYIALTDFEARKHNRNLFDDALIEKVHDYRAEAADYMRYANEHPTNDPETDGTMERKLKQLADKAKVLSKALGPVIRDADGLSQRDIADVMTELAQRHHVALSRKAAQDEIGMNSRDVEKITLDEIANALANRAVQNAEYEALEREADRRRVA